MPSFIRKLKDRVDEDTNYEQQISYFVQFLQHNMFIIPIPFAKHHKQMQAHAKEMLEYRNGLMAIHPHPSFFFSLDTKSKRQYLLKQGVDSGSHDDLFDSFGMSLRLIR
jgi:hypothetical protein